jgi:hypothetical protein
MQRELLNLQLDGKKPIVLLAMAIEIKYKTYDDRTIKIQTRTRSKCQLAEFLKNNRIRYYRLPSPVAYQNMPEAAGTESSPPPEGEKTAVLLAVATKSPV